MRRSIPLGKLAGIEVGAHWSVLVVLVLVGQVLATGVLPQQVPDASTAAIALTSVAVAVAFLASLLAHEAAHAVVAQRHGVRVRSITLWALGGVTQLDGEAPDARADLRIALVGPLVSLGCGAAAGAAAVLAAASGWSGVLVAGLQWLAVTNLLLGVFNLLPGAPLDGGRVLRAVMWRRKGDRHLADIAAGRAGRRVGLALVVLGGLEVLAGSLIGGLWVALIGWFISAAAGAELAAAQRTVELTGQRVRDATRTDVAVVGSWQPLDVAAERAVLGDCDYAVSADVDGFPVGIVAVDLLVAQRRTSPHLTVATLATPVPPTGYVTLDEPLADALRRAAGFPVLVVVDDRRLVGLVTSVDVRHAARRGALATVGPGGPGGPAG